MNIRKFIKSMVARGLRFAGMEDTSPTPQGIPENVASQIVNYIFQNKPHQAEDLMSDKERTWARESYPKEWMTPEIQQYFMQQARDIMGEEGANKWFIDLWGSRIPTESPPGDQPQDPEQPQQSLEQQEANNYAKFLQSEFGYNFFDGAVKNKKRGLVNIVGDINEATDIVIGVLNRFIYGKKGLETRDDLRVRFFLEPGSGQMALRSNPEFWNTFNNAIAQTEFIDASGSAVSGLTADTALGPLWSLSYWLSGLPAEQAANMSPQEIKSVAAQEEVRMQSQSRQERAKGRKPITQRKNFREKIYDLFYAVAGEPGVNQMITDLIDSEKGYASPTGDPEKDAALRHNLINFLWQNAEKVAKRGLTTTDSLGRATSLDQDMGDEGSRRGDFVADPNAKSPSGNMEDRETDEEAARIRDFLSKAYPKEDTKEDTVKQIGEEAKEDSVEIESIQSGKEKAKKIYESAFDNLDQFIEYFRQSAESVEPGSLDKKYWASLMTADVSDTFASLAEDLLPRIFASQKNRQADRGNWKIDLGKEDVGDGKPEPIWARFGFNLLDAEMTDGNGKPIGEFRMEDYDPDVPSFEFSPALYKKRFRAMADLKTQIADLRYLKGGDEAQAAAVIASVTGRDINNPEDLEKSLDDARWAYKQMDALGEDGFYHAIKSMRKVKHRDSINHLSHYFLKPFLRDYNGAPLYRSMHPSVRRAILSVAPMRPWLYAGQWSKPTGPDASNPKKVAEKLATGANAWSIDEGFENSNTTHYYNIIGVEMPDIVKQQFVYFKEWKAKYAEMMKKSMIAGEFKTASNDHMLYLVNHYLDLDDKYKRLTSISESIGRYASVDDEIRRLDKEMDAAFGEFFDECGYT